METIIIGVNLEALPGFKYARPSWTQGNTRYVMNTNPTIMATPDGTGFIRDFDFLFDTDNGHKTLVTTLARVDKRLEMFDEPPLLEQHILLNNSRVAKNAAKTGYLPSKIWDEVGLDFVDVRKLKDYNVTTEGAVVSCGWSEDQSKWIALTGPNGMIYDVISLALPAESFKLEDIFSKIPGGASAFTEIVREVVGPLKVVHFSTANNGTWWISKFNSDIGQYADPVISIGKHHQVVDSLRRYHESFIEHFVKFWTSSNQRPPVPKPTFPVPPPPVAPEPPRPVPVKEDPKKIGKAIHIDLTKNYEAKTDVNHPAVIRMPNGSIWDYRLERDEMFRKVIATTSKLPVITVKGVQIAEFKSGDEPLTMKLGVMIPGKPYITYFDYTKRDIATIIPSPLVLKGPFKSINGVLQQLREVTGVVLTKDDLGPMTLQRIKAGESIKINKYSKLFHGEIEVRYHAE